MKIKNCPYCKTSDVDYHCDCLHGKMYEKYVMCNACMSIGLSGTTKTKSIQNWNAGKIMLGGD